MLQQEVNKTNYCAFRVRRTFVCAILYFYAYLQLFVKSQTIVTPARCCNSTGVTFTRVGTLIVATIYLQLIQNRYMFRSFTVLQCSHQHCVQPVSSDVEVVGYL